MAVAQWPRSEQWTTSGGEDPAGASSLRLESPAAARTDAPSLLFANNMPAAVQAIAAGAGTTGTGAGSTSTAAGQSFAKFTRRSKPRQRCQHWHWQLLLSAVCASCMAAAAGATGVTSSDSDTSAGPSSGEGGGEPIMPHLLFPLRSACLGNPP